MTKPLPAEAGAGPSPVGGPVTRPGATAVLTAWLRRRLWRPVLFLTGGITVKGRLPRGGCVVVADHPSHADTAALLAALDARHAPRVAAAADYWFRNWPRKTVGSVPAVAFPVRRNGIGFRDLLETGVPLLHAGHAVVLYPEGTRGNGPAGKFHGGTVELAAHAAVPVTLVGTRELLPKGGRLRPSTVQVRIGRPLTAPGTGDARSAVLAPAAQCRRRDSRVRRHVSALAVSGWGLVLAGGWAFAEALSRPLLPELALAVLCVAAPRAGVRLTASAVLGSVAGGLLTLMLHSGTSVTLPQPPAGPRMHATVQEELRREGAATVRHQPSSGIPYKVYSSEAGRAHVPPGTWVVRSALARGKRFVMVGLVLTFAGAVTQRWQRFFPYYLIVLGVTFTVLFELVLRMWR